MARKATEFPAQGVQMSDFKWTKNMTKKDRGSAKLFIDGILADVEKRDRAIMDMGEQLTKMKIDVNRKLGELRDRKDYEIGLLKKKAVEYQALYEHENGKNTTLVVITIIACLIMLGMGIYYFA